VASGVAREFIELDEYRTQLESRLGRARGLMRGLAGRASMAPKRIVFPEGEDPKVLRAAQILVAEGIAHPILLGRQERVRATAEELGISLDGVHVEEPAASPHRERYAQYLWERRQRKGLSLTEAGQRVTRATTFGSVMVAMGDADALLGGLGKHYPETIRPALEVIGADDRHGLVSGLYMLVFEKHIIFVADTTVNITPTAEQLAQIGWSASMVARTFGIEPRVAMLSFSNFGSVRHPDAEKMAAAVRILRQRDPSLVVDGEMQADTALSAEILAKRYPFATLKEPANVLIFPDLSAGNISYKLLAQLGGATAIGPILVGMQHPVHVLEQDADVQEIVNMAAVAVIDAQTRPIPTASYTP